jgi:transcriptional regulator with XRE-family HTH domain
MQTERRLLPRERHWTCARRLRERRTELGLTQVEIAEALRRGGSDLGNRTLSAMEHGQALDLGWLPELAAALDCTTTYLLGLTADPHSWRPDPIDTASIDADPLAPPPSNAPAAANAADAAPDRCSWILGPDIPDRRPATE